MDKNNVSNKANEPTLESTVGPQSSRQNRFLLRVNKLCLGFLLIGVIVVGIIIAFGGTGTKLEPDAAHKYPKRGWQNGIDQPHVGDGRDVDDSLETSWDQTEVQFASVHKQLLPGNMSHSYVTEHDLHCDPLQIMAFLNEDFNGPTEHTSGVDVFHDSLRIIYAGLYHVYFNVHMKLQGWDHKGSLHQKCMDHSVFLQSQGLREVVLSISNNVGMRHPAEQTAHSEGEFYLQSGDLIFVCLCSSGIEHTPQATFVGMFLVSAGTSMPEQQF